MNLYILIEGDWDACMTSDMKLWLLQLFCLDSLVKLGQSFTAELTEKALVIFREQDSFVSCSSLDSEQNYLLEVDTFKLVVLLELNVSSLNKMIGYSWATYKFKLYKYLCTNGTSAAIYTYDVKFDLSVKYVSQFSL